MTATATTSSTSVPQTVTVSEAPSGRVAGALIVSGAFSVKKTGEAPFVYSSGLLSPCYVDCRVLQGHPGAFHAVTMAFVHLLRSKRNTFDIIAGVPNGAITYSMVVAMLLKVPHLWIYKDGPKDHGTDKVYGGADPMGKRVHFIEDVFTTGSSVTTTVEKLAPLGGVISGASGIFSSNPAKVRLNLQESHGIYTDILTDLPALIYQLSVTGRITDEEADRVAEWHLDPRGWSERYKQAHPA